MKIIYYAIAIFIILSCISIAEPVYNFTYTGFTFYDDFTSFNQSIWKTEGCGGYDATRDAISGSIVNGQGGAILNDSRFNFDLRGDWNITITLWASQGESQDDNIYAHVTFLNTTSFFSGYNNTLIHYNRNSLGGRYILQHVLDSSLTSEHDISYSDCVDEYTVADNDFNVTLKINKINTPSNKTNVKIYYSGEICNNCAGPCVDDLIYDYNSNFGVNDYYPNLLYNYFAFECRGISNSGVRLFDVNISYRDFPTIPLINVEGEIGIINKSFSYFNISSNEPISNCNLNINGINKTTLKINDTYFYLNYSLPENKNITYKAYCTNYFLNTGVSSENWVFYFTPLKLSLIYPENKSILTEKNYDNFIIINISKKNQNCSILDYSGNSWKRISETEFYSNSILEGLHKIKISCGINNLNLRFNYNNSDQKIKYLLAFIIWVGFGGLIWISFKFKSEFYLILSGIYGLLTCIYFFTNINNILGLIYMFCSIFIIVLLLKK